MRDDRNLVVSLFGIKSAEMTARFDYLVGSLASFENDIQTRKGTSDERHTFSFGELAMINNYAQQLLEMTKDFYQLPEEDGEQTVERINANSEVFKLL